MAPLQYVYMYMCIYVRNPANHGKEIDTSQLTEVLIQDTALNKTLLQDNRCPDPLYMYLQLTLHFFLSGQGSSS